LAVDVSEKRGTVSPFQQVILSSIIQAFLKINMNMRPLNLTKSYFTNVVAASLCRCASALLPPSPRRSGSAVATALLATALLGCFPSLAIADIININPIKDNTLYQFVPADGDLSNALGNHFFAGETGMGELRRGVLAFDIAGNIPPGSTILGVTLSLNMSRTGLDDARNVELHKMLASWGEGTSQATGDEGQGAPATTNDATWRHRFFDTIFWATEGGDFSATVSATQSVGAVGMYMWSSPPMIGDVQSWLNNPATNFGWLVLGDESEILTAKRFDTRESASPPVLTIQYTPGVPRPTPTPRPRPTPNCGRVPCGPTPAPPAPRSTSAAFPRPLLFLLRLFATQPAV
jgi:hypothetical protein